MIRSTFLALSALVAAAGIAVAQGEPLDTIISDYEAYVISHSPYEAARAAGRPMSTWADVSPEAVSQRAEEARALLARVETLNDDTSPEREILESLLQQAIDAETFDEARIPFTGDWGFNAEPVFAARSVDLSHRENIDPWLSLLEATPAYFDQNIANMRRGLETGWVSHADPLATTMDQVSQQAVDTVEASPLWKPFQTLPETMSEPDKDAVRAQGRAAIEAILISYRDLKTFFETEYKPNARSHPGIVSLPGGREYYSAVIAQHTAGAGYSAEEIHELGKREVARIREEMNGVMAETGFDGSFEEFLVFLRSDPQFYATDPEDLLEKASEIAKRLDAVLPRYFGKLPRLTYGVEAVPADIAPGYTTGRYVEGDPQRGISGTYLVNTYKLDQRPLYELPALSAHEAVPGHHIQIALAQELEDVSAFRQSYYATAFGEGWGLYSEKLAGEAGIYRTPYERFGQLSYEMWRACRLVADTGMHWYDWSREEASACFYDNSALAPLNIEVEVTRYIGWPAQATAYKVGELKILELRARAKAALGEAFDIRDYHDVVLGAGSMPLDALERRVDDWIASHPKPDAANR